MCFCGMNLPGHHPSLGPFLAQCGSRRCRGSGYLLQGSPFLPSWCWPQTVLCPSGLSNCPAQLTAPANLWGCSEPLSPAVCIHSLDTDRCSRQLRWLSGNLPSSERQAWAGLQRAESVPPGVPPSQTLAAHSSLLQMCRRGWGRQTELLDIPSSVSNCPHPTHPARHSQASQCYALLHPRAHPELGGSYCATQDTTRFCGAAPSPRWLSCRIASRCLVLGSLASASTPCLPLTSLRPQGWPAGGHQLQT